MSSSMLYTMGMALDRAAENGVAVEVLVEGAWLTGRVVGNDGMGVILESVDLGKDGLGQSHAIVKTERISAVRVASASPAMMPLGCATQRTTSPC